jgi:hypothetical protein
VATHDAWRCVGGALRLACCGETRNGHLVSYVQSQMARLVSRARVYT